MLKPIHSLALLVACASFSACATVQKPMTGICTAEVAAGSADESKSQELPADVWYSVLLQGYDRDSGRLSEDATTCANGPLALAPAQPELCSAAPVGTMLSREPLTPEDLMIVPVDEGVMLWAKTQRYDNGDAEGPLAIVKWEKRGVAVVELGVFRAPEKEVSIRLEPGAVPLLVAEAQQCEGDVCATVVQMAVRRGGRIDVLPLQAPDGTCLGAARFVLEESRVVDIDESTSRRFQVVRDLRFTEEGVTIGESILIEDSDPNAPDDPARPFRDINNERPLSVTATSIVLPAGSWADMVDRHGSVAVDEE